MLGEKNTLRGFTLAVTGNFHKYFGAKFDYSFHVREDNFSRPAGSGTIDTTVQNFLGGIQVKNNLEDGPTLKPFGHALFGVANQKIDLDSPQLPVIFGISDFHVNETSFAVTVGGGLDIKLNERFDIRAIQVDWNMINRGDQQMGIVLVPTPFQTVGTPFFIPKHEAGQPAAEYWYSVSLNSAFCEQFLAQTRKEEQQIHAIHRVCCLCGSRKPTREQPVNSDSIKAPQPHSIPLSK